MERFSAGNPLRLLPIYAVHIQLYHTSTAGNLQGIRPAAGRHFSTAVPYSPSGAPAPVSSGSARLPAVFHSPAPRCRGKAMYFPVKKRPFPKEGAFYLLISCLR
jgi:hypothetical protein